MAEKSGDTSPAETPTSSKGEEKQSNNWWDSWISSAKSKSAEVYTMVKKDLDEIGTAVKCEASHVFNTTSNVLGKTLKLDEPESPANVMKKSFSSFIGQMSTVLNPEPDDEDDTEVILSSGDTTMLSTYKKELEALQRVDATFIVPAYSPEFDAWKSTLDGGTDLFSPVSAVKRLDTSPLLKSQYEKLVPDAVSHEEFWERYLFRVALLQDRLAASARKQPIENPTADPVLAHLPLQTEIPPPVITEGPKKVLTDTDMMDVQEDAPEAAHAVSWEDEDFANDVELTEEQQILLLEEYEKEIASKKLAKQTNTRDVANNNTKNKNGNTKNKNGKKAADSSPGNIVEDYFGEVQKDDSSANSDESWEKEFEIDDVQK